MTLSRSAGFREGLRLGGVLLVLLAVGAAPSEVRAETGTGTSRALIIVGLPGDDAHAERFDRLVEGLRSWLTGATGFDAGQVRVLGGRGSKAVPATREAIADAVRALKEGLSAEDRVWVFWIGHANLDRGHAFLHLPGPDLRDDQFRALFREVACRESVFWMTSACSGWFLQDLAAPGRIVIGATERDQEINETEFPAALASIVARPAAEVDSDKDGKISVLELFRAVVKEVETRFSSDKRVPTEHAQLEDNGDGKGSEAPRADGADGPLAARTFLNWRR